MAIVIGVDPGFASFGWAAVELVPLGAEPDRFNLEPFGLHQCHERVVELGVIRTEPSARKRSVRASEDNVRRAREVYAALAVVLDRHHPVAVCAEAMSYPRCSSAAAKMSLGWGVLVASCAERGVPIVQCSPQEMKLAVAGSKSAGKVDVQEALTMRFGDDLGDMIAATNKTLREHVADAVGAVVGCLDCDVIRMARRMAA